MSSYFYNLYKEEQKLRKHGFQQPPSEKELLEKVFDLEDRIKKLETADNSVYGGDGND